jgi:hypothetical protein
VFRLIRSLFQWKVLKWVSISCILFIILLWGINNILVACWSNYDLRYNHPKKYAERIDFLDRVIHIPPEYIVTPSIHEELHQKIFGSETKPQEHWNHLKEQNLTISRFMWNKPSTKSQWLELNETIHKLQPTINYYELLSNDVCHFLELQIKNNNNQNLQVITKNAWELTPISELLYVASNNALRHGDIPKANQYLLSSLLYMTKYPTIFTRDLGVTLRYNSDILRELLHTCSNCNDEEILKKILHVCNQFETYIISDLAVGLDDPIYVLLASTADNYDLSEEEICLYEGKTVREYFRYLAQKTIQFPGVFECAYSLFEMYAGDYHNRDKITVRWELMKSLAFSSLSENEVLINRIFHYPDINYIANEKKKVISAMNMIRLTIAIRLYEEEHGVKPTVISQLVPKFISQELKDPYFGQEYQIDDTGEIEKAIKFESNE